MHCRGLRTAEAHAQDRSRDPFTAEAHSLPRPIHCRGPFTAEAHSLPRPIQCQKAHSMLSSLLRTARTQGNTIQVRELHRACAVHARARAGACWQPKSMHMRKHTVRTVPCIRRDQLQTTGSATDLSRKKLIARARARPFIRGKNALRKCASLALGCRRTKPASPHVAHPRLHCHAATWHRNLSAA